MGRVLSVVSLLCGALASGCADVPDQLLGRYGPNPVPTATAVETAATRQRDVVIAMARGAGYTNAAPAFGARQEWYTVIMTGFNVVDDACVSYIDDLWILERRKTRNGALIAATGAATAGIVAASAHPSAATLEILAQAFGLTAAFNTAISDSYLYTQNAATIKKLLRKTTEAYRTDLAKKVDTETEVSYPIGSPGAAYHHMREYLALCLPPTIQAQIEDLVANAKAVPENSNTDAALTKAKVDASATGRVVITGGTATKSATTAIKVQ
jgi:hypothetical protein